MNVIIVPSRPEGAHYFLREMQWIDLKINDKNIENLKYIALYQTAPVSAITHYAKIKKIEKYEINYYYKKIRKYKALFEDIKELNIVLDNSSNRKLIIQSLRYADLKNLLKSKTLSELFKK